AERDDQVVVAEHVRRRVKPRRQGHGARFQIDGLDLAHVDLGAAEEPAQRRDDVGEPDRPRDDLGEEGLEDEVDLAVDEDDLDVLATLEPLLEPARAVDAGEAAAEDDDALLHREFSLRTSRTWWPSGSVRTGSAPAAMPSRARAAARSS